MPKARSETFCSATYVPDPTLRSNKPSSTSVCTACRSVIRDTLKAAANSRSAGSRLCDCHSPASMRALI